MEPASEKKALRAAIRENLRDLSAAGQKQTAGKARALLEQQRVWETAHRILFYAPLAYELNVWPLLEDAIRTGKEAYLPRFVDPFYVACRILNLQTDLGPGRFGIREPVSGSPEI